MTMLAFVLVGLITTISAGPSNDSFKDQYCTDPRTMQKHAAYSEWADAYSCTRHRCQPGGRNLAIYTVGCKRVEAPESAIECEEVVEDTNMQFPFCCTRLRCLVVVRGEVWTRVLGQPWETLPAAPWSHMYKMKKPPPGDTSFLNKETEQKGPVYELSEQDAPKHEQVLRSEKRTTEDPNCKEAVLRSAPTPDIVIALSTNNDEKEPKRDIERRKRVHEIPDEERNEPENQDVEELPASTDKPLGNSDEAYNSNTDAMTKKPKTKIQNQVTWTEIPPNQWTERDPSMDAENVKDVQEEKKEVKSSNLQALVDAIGTRMRDIETVVQKMSQKVQQVKPEDAVASSEKRSDEGKRHERKEHEKNYDELKKPSPDGDHYKRFVVSSHSKYLHSADGVTEKPLYIEDNTNGYYSDASNSVIRRVNVPKEPSPTYMAPVETRRKSIHPVPENSEEVGKKRKKHSHKKKGKGKSHKKHRKDEKRRRYNRISSEVDKNVVSLEDNSANKK
ncbi:uncharacterized protein LOC101736094 [Bombyx mori]|uniref:Single domain-containing protein n=1 Tax=Bombyx mori TaxID=7091 RepID=A0A8R2G8D9_BOMMO|nr:uncharacterized protein LOC101736094 isoform X2 [Bombyx mori]